jgi:hypothetical protein
LIIDALTLVYATIATTAANAHILIAIDTQQQGATRLAIGVQGGFLTDAQRFDLVKEHALALYDTATQQFIRVLYPDAQDRYPTVVCQAADAVIAHQVSALVHVTHYTIVIAALCGFIATLLHNVAVVAILVVLHVIITKQSHSDAVNATIGVIDHFIKQCDCLAVMYSVRVLECRSWLLAGAIPSL